MVPTKTTAAQVYRKHFILDGFGRGGTYVGGQGVTLFVDVSEERGSVNYEGPLIVLATEKAQTGVQPHAPNRRKTRGRGMLPRGDLYKCRRPSGWCAGCFLHE